MWSRALAEAFFSSDFAGEPVTFAVDSDALAAITGDPPELAIESLAHCVRELVMPNYRFYRIRDMARCWRSAGCDGPPPSLPLLALTVLAFGANEKFGLYKPLRRLLDPDDHDGGMPGDFDYSVPEMWEQLAWWLETHQQGNFGLPTITKHEFYVNVGYSRQQALLRTGDRTLVYRFFRSIGLAPAEEQVVASELRRALAIWSNSRLPRTARLHRLATDPALAKYADALLQTLAARWDGRLRDPRSGSLARVLRLMLELRPVDLAFVALHRDGDHETVDVTLPSGAMVTLEAGDAAYEPFPLPLAVTPDSIRKGVELTGEKLSFFHEGGRAVPFRYDGDVLEWVSSDRIGFDEKHHLLVHNDIREATLTWLEIEQFGGRLDVNATKTLPQGWFLVRDLQLRGRPQHQAPPDVGDLIGNSGGGGRLRLVGGLKIKGLGRTYLTGGAPNVALPEGHRDMPFEIKKQGFEPIERVATGHEFLMGAFDLPPGEYEVSQQGVGLKFTVINSLREFPGPAVGSVRTRGGDDTSMPGLILDNNNSVPRPVVVRAVASGPIIVVGPGSDDHCVVDAPRWLEHLAGPLSWTALDVWAAFQPAWLLVPTARRSAPLYTAWPVTPLAPAGSAAGTQWARLIAAAELVSDSSESIEELWSQYAAAAAEKAT
jgi:hypothetical protein